MTLGGVPFRISTDISNCKTIWKEFQVSKSVYYLCKSGHQGLEWSHYEISTNCVTIILPTLSLASKHIGKMSSCSEIYFYIDIESRKRGDLVLQSIHHQIYSDWFNTLVPLLQRLDWKARI